LALVRIDGALVAWRPHAPVRPFANDGARVAVLGPHPRGGYFPELSVFDARDATWSEEWPASFPTSVLSGHWAAKSMVIFDLAGRRERLLRQDKRDDYQHHTSSPDGRYAWLHEAPQEGIVDVIDGTCAFDLAAIDCGKRRGNFTRAFVQHADSAFRIYTRGAFYRGRERVWSDHAAHARHAAAFDRAGARLVTVDSANVRIRALDALGHVTSEVISKLPLTRRDFSLPPELAEPLLGDLLFGEVGPLTMIAERAEEEVCARVVEAVRALPSWDRPKRNDDEIEQWTRRAHAYARAHDAGPRGHGGM
jgi:hypothetical protein